MYIMQINIFFKQIIIKKSYKKQILYYNVEKLSLIIKHNIDIFFFIKILIKIIKNIILQLKFISSVKKNHQKLEIIY